MPNIFGEETEDEREFRELRQRIAELDAQVDALQDRVHLCAGYDRLRAALEFYANPDSYPDERLHRLTTVARAALNPEEKDGQG